jgi:hypothetical protein
MHYHQWEPHLAISINNRIISTSGNNFEPAQL